MTKDEAIEILWRYDVNFEPHPAEEVMHAIDMAIEALKAQPHWILCSEGLPEDNIPVLIYAWNVHYVVARYGQFRTGDYTYKETWVTADAWNGNTEIKDEVIAWQPLPEPYDDYCSFANRKESDEE